MRHSRQSLKTVLRPLYTLWLRACEKFPLTLPGVLVLILTLGSLNWFGYRRMDLVVFALTVCAIAIVLFSLLMVVSTGLIYRQRLRKVLPTLPDNSVKLEAGYPNETGFRLRALTWMPLVSLNWRVIHPQNILTNNRISEDGRYMEEEITSLRRCLSPRITRLFTVSDVLGLSRFSWRQSQDARLFALPARGRIRHLPALRSMSAEDGIPEPTGQPQGDRMEIRPYTPGDPVRNIMWRIYARNRHLNVRLEEKSVFDSRRTLAYLLSGPNDEAAAAVARVAIESGVLGDDWVFGADGSDQGSDTVAGALEKLAASRALDEPHSYGLDRFLDQQQNSNAHCIVFAAASPGQWPEALRRTVARHPGQFSVILATDGFAEQQAQPLLQRLLYDPGRKGDEEQLFTRPVASVTELSGLLNELRQFTGAAMIVDRRTGSSFDQQLKRV